MPTWWAYLALIPFLCFTAVAVLPHQHGQHRSVGSSYLTPGLSSVHSTLFAPAATDDDADGCALCQVQMVFANCVFTHTVFIFAPAWQHQRISPVEKLLPRTVLIDSSARGPPLPFA